MSSYQIPPSTSNSRQQPRQRFIFSSELPTTPAAGNHSAAPKGALVERETQTTPVRDDLHLICEQLEEDYQEYTQAVAALAGKLTSF
jgi:hypothetical protein